MAVNTYTFNAFTAYTLEEIELSDGHNDAVESGHTRKSDRTIPMTNILENIEKANDPGKFLLDESAKLDKQNNNGEIQDNQSGQENGDNVSDSVGLNFGTGDVEEFMTLPRVKELVKSVL